MTLEEFNKIKENLYNEFWNLDKLDIIPELRKKYENNLSAYVTNAHKLRYDYPIETTELLLHIFKSNFGIKLLTEWNDIFKTNSNDWNIEKKIRFIKKIYENSYHYFIFLTLSENYSNNFIISLYKYWFNPNKGKEFQNNVEDKPWKNGNETINGKCWVLLNCPFFSEIPEDIKLVRDIRNYESHEKLIITKKGIFLPKEDGTSKYISKEDFDSIVNHSISSLKLAIHHYIKLIFEFHFWILPIIYLSNSEKFKNNTIPLDLIDLNEEKKKINLENLTKDEGLNRHVTLFLLLYQYTNSRIWDIFVEQKMLINKFLEQDNLILNLEGIERTKVEIKSENIKMVGIVIKKLTNFIYKEEYTIKENELDTLNDFFKLIERFKDSIDKKDNKDRLSNDDYWTILTFGITLIGYVFINPLAKLKNNLKKIVVNKHNFIK